MIHCVQNVNYIRISTFTGMVVIACSLILAMSLVAYQICQNEIEETKSCKELSETVSEFKDCIE